MVVAILITPSFGRISRLMEAAIPLVCALPLNVTWSSFIFLNFTFCQPLGELLEAINRDFGSVGNLKTRLSASTVAVQGSGWGWLVCIL